LRKLWLATALMMTSAFVVASVISMSSFNALSNSYQSRWYTLACLIILHSHCMGLKSGKVL
jgi:hypothetical protein